MHPKAVYIHIPFCHEICHYCDFAKMYYNEKIADDYLEALHKEMSLYISNEKIDVETIYLGGGTPTSLNPNQLKKLFETIHHFINVEQVKEFTIEANPGEFKEEHVQLMKEYGVNRISLGVQVLDDAYLKQLNRIHGIADVDTSVHSLQKYGLTNISMDFIYALPNQSLNHFESTLSHALSYDLPHYSSYALQIEPKTVFYIRYQEGKLTKPKEETEAKMFTSLINMMDDKGRKHYEISNFSKPGYESQHNLMYWDNVPYYAFGAGAHGYFEQERYVNLRPVNHYLDAIKKSNKPVLHREPVDRKAQIEEEMFLGLRKKIGVSEERFKNRYGLSMFDLYSQEINSFIDKGWMIHKDNHVSLTQSGMLFGNEVFASFLIDNNSKNANKIIDSQ
ncbi:radical SAM family heme chaperone HemW [Halalkalibacillus halophilus]|uniref:radical SAM family heme chaperone HemW n=1 Tax=Halalkalibacillus halophilus TaxID=392827 RepID=UPI0004136254|nr:radical SAM family heme chaperone HemW [Halalkalibacillus halophilus]